jgi:predicted esterase
VEKQGTGNREQGTGNGALPPAPRDLGVARAVRTDVAARRSSIRLTRAGGSGLSSFPVPCSLFFFFFCCFSLLLASPAHASDGNWCHESLETLEDEVCYEPGAQPEEEGKRTLVVFLHGLVDGGTDWQHQQQRGMALAAKRLKFSMIAPRGRSGLGGKRRDDQIGWPTSETAREAMEDEVIAEWMKAKETIETREGKKFDRVFVMGFSNGAYYASSLALRGKLDVDGYAVFAGGSAFPGAERLGKATKNKKPVFVGVATKDSTAKDGQGLVKLLKKLKWPHASSSKKVGHVVADTQLESAVAFLRGDSKKPKATATKSTKKKPKKKS